MRNTKIHDWLSITAAVSVLVGLLFVAFELQQNNQLAQAETIRELWGAHNELRKFELQIGLLPLVRKSVEDPLGLTDDEIDRLDTYLQIVMQQQLTVSLMSDKYLLALIDTEAQAADIVDDVLTGRFARGWFAANEYWLTDRDPELIRAVKQELARTPAKTEHTWPSEIRESVKQVVDRE